MLIEFKVANFRSFHEEQTLSMVASNREKDLPQCRVDRPDLPGLKGIKFLKGAAIYGPNASGKSNLLKAVQFFVRFMCDSATRTQSEDPTGTTPFRLDQATMTSPSSFEMSFVIGDARYMIGLSLDTGRVHQEYAYSYPKGLPRRLYRRTLDLDTGKHEWEGPSDGPGLDHGLIEKTRDNASFLSVAAQWRHVELESVRRGLREGLISLIPEGFGLGPTATVFSDPATHSAWVDRLRVADLGIDEVTTNWTPFAGSPLTHLASEMERPPAPHTSKIQLAFRNPPGASGDDLEILDLKFGHRAAGGRTVMFSPEDESEGTLRFFTLLGPWLEALARGRTLFLDEIEAHLHPILVRKLLELFFSKEHNPLGAQIIFATHDTTLLTPTLLRRDQVWFVDKTREGASRLYGLLEYKPRKDEAFGRGYMLGRYGAIPFIPEGLMAEPAK